MFKNLFIDILKLIPYKWQMELGHCLFIADYEEQDRRNALKRFDLTNWQKEQDERPKK